MEPSISFVMPVRDRAAMLGEAIGSIVAQTAGDWELIVVDDNSADAEATREVVASFRDARIRPFRLDGRHGSNAACARNFGNALARAPIIAVADSDDIFYPDRARCTLDAFATHGCDVFYADFDVWDCTADRFVETSSDPVIAFDPAALARYDFIPHGSSACRRNLALMFPYNSFMTRSSDYDFFTRLAVFGARFHFHAGKIYKYRLHDGSLVRRYNAASFDDFIRQSRGWSPWDRALTGRLVDDLALGSRA
jgi:glycosyltransferase involved in cell wall biosynthesis